MLKTSKLRNKAEKREGYLGSERIECFAFAFTTYIYIIYIE